MVQYSFTSTETIRLLRTGAQDGHLDSHTQLLSSAQVEVTAACDILRENKWERGGAVDDRHLIDVIAPTRIS